MGGEGGEGGEEGELGGLGWVGVVRGWGGEERGGEDGCDGYRGGLNVSVVSHLRSYFNSNSIAVPDA